MRGSRWYVVGLLAALYILSAADRLILSLLVEPLKAELLLADTQIALLIGPAFAMLYAVLGLPVAWLADRFSRKWIAVIGVVLWSACTIGSAFATNFNELFALRMGLALGEAVLSPVAISLIADLFERDRRSAPTATYVSSGVIGFIVAFAAGGALIQLLEIGAFAGVPVIGTMSVWRATLVLVGAPGIALAILMALTTREPARGRLDTAEGYAPPAGSFGAFESRKDGIWFYVAFFCGNSICQTLTYGCVAWAPTYLIRGYGISTADAGYVLSIGLTVAAVLTFAIPATAQWLAKAWRPDALLVVLLVILPLGFAALALGFMQSSLTGAIVATIVGFGILSSTNGQASIVVALTAPANLRGQLMAVNLAMGNIVGLSLGSYLVAWTAENYFTGPKALGGGLIAVALVTMPLAWLCLLASIRPYGRAMRQALAPPVA